MAKKEKKTGISEKITFYMLESMPVNAELAFVWLI